MAINRYPEQELAGRLIKTSGRYALAKNKLNDLYRAFVGIEFRHSSLHCTCAICQDMRRGLPVLLKDTGELLEKLKESESTD